MYTWIRFATVTDLGAVKVWRCAQAWEYSCDHNSASSESDSKQGNHFVTPLLLSKNISNNVFDDGSPPNVCSLVFTKACEERLFPSANCRAERQVRVQRNVEKDENFIDIAQRNSCIITRRISARLRVPRTRVWRTFHTDGM